MEAFFVSAEHIRRQPILCDDARRRMTLAASFWNVRRRNARRRQFDGRNRMLTVAIGADRRIAHAGLDGHTVNAMLVGLRDVFMALAACGRRIFPIQFGDRIGGPVQIVRAVAIGADSGVDFFFLQQRDALHALFIAHHRTALPEMEFFHLGDFVVTPAASLRLIGPVNGRSWVPVVQ